MSEMTPDTRPLSQRMLLDGMYPGIVEKWAAEVAGLEAHIEALENETCPRCGSRLFIRCRVCAGDEEPASLAEEEKRP